MKFNKITWYESHPCFADALKLPALHPFTSPARTQAPAIRAADAEAEGRAAAGWRRTFWCEMMLAEAGLRGRERDDSSGSKPLVAPLAHMACGAAAS